jgi:hypothetical protein
MLPVYYKVRGWTPTGAQKTYAQKVGIQDEDDSLLCANTRRGKKGIRGNELARSGLLVYINGPMEKRLQKSKKLLIVVNDVSIGLFQAKKRRFPMATSLVFAVCGGLSRIVICAVYKKRSFQIKRKDRFLICRQVILRCFLRCFTGSGVGAGVKSTQSSYRTAPYRLAR